MTEKITSDEILKRLADRHTDDFFMTEVKNGPTQLGRHIRMDAVAIKKSWTSPCISAYEVKVSRNDFVRDDKWPGYMNYCNKFAFACPEGLIQKDELPPEVGLFWYRGADKHFKIVRQPVYRTVDIPADFFMYIIMNRIQSDRYPFFNSKEEYFRECIEGKKTARSLGHQLSYKIAEELHQMERDMNRAIEEAKQAEEAVQERKKAIELLRIHGISWHSWRENWVDGLKTHLESGSKGNDFQLRKAIEHAEGTLNYLKAIGGEQQ